MHPAWGWLLGCQLMRPSFESSALGALCLPHVPCMRIASWDVTLSWVVSVSGPFQRWCVLAASLHSMHGSLVSGASPFWCWRCGLKTTFPHLLLLFGDRGPRPPRPYRAASSTVALTRGYRGGTPFWHRHIPGTKPGQRLRPVNAWGRSTPLLTSLAPLMGLTMLILINARGRIGTTTINTRTTKETHCLFLYLRCFS